MQYESKRGIVRSVPLPQVACFRVAGNDAQSGAAGGALMGGVPVDIPEGSPLPHAEVQAGLTYRRRGPVTSALAAEIKVWRDALRALRSMSRQSAVASVTSGLICGLVMFVFCVVFSEMIFGQHELLMRAVPAQSPP